MSVSVLCQTGHTGGWTGVVCKAPRLVFEHAAIPVYVEAGIEQPEPGLEVLMHGRGLALQALPQ